MTAGWLNMGGAPPTTTLTVLRRALPGRRFLVQWLPCWRRPATLPGTICPDPQTPYDWALANGIPGVLALLGSDARGTPYTRSELARRARGLSRSATAAALERAVDARLKAVGLAHRIGVFADDDCRQDSDIEVPDGVALAILLRRSGPLYMPKRPPELSLVVPQRTTLIFPEDGDVDDE